MISFKPSSCNILGSKVARFFINSKDAAQKMQFTDARKGKEQRNGKFGIMSQRKMEVKFHGIVTCPG